MKNENAMRIVGRDMFTGMLALAMAISTAAVAGAIAETAAPIQIRGGTASFEVGTNVFAISVHGKSSALTARARVREDGGAMMVEDIEASLPVMSLETGLALRDEHMRKHIFTTADGQVPDLKFNAESSMCEPAGRESACRVNGQLAVRGTSRPFAITLKVKKDGGAFKATGEGVLKLSEYGIPQPSQLGVKTLDEVTLHLAFTANAAGASTPSTERGR